MNDEWKLIKKHYQNAVDCLWCPVGYMGDWSRDEDNGYFYLWSAYHMAQGASDPVEHLIYARILAMMADEIRCSYYDTYYKYLLPSSQQYRLAIDAGDRPTDKELEKNQFLLRSFEHKVKSLSDSEEAIAHSYELIEGSEQIEGFGFHDSHILHFEHDLNSAEMVLEYDTHDIVFTLKFQNIYSIESCLDPAGDWIDEFHCYTDSCRPEVICFDIGIYRIYCEKIIVEDVSRCV